MVTHSPLGEVTDSQADLAQGLRPHPPKGLFGRLGVTFGVEATGTGKTMGATLAITKDNFKQEVLDSEVPVLVDFWATWCPPCLRIAPVVEEMAGTYDGKGKVAKVDVDSNQALAMEYNIQSIPALIIFKGGREVDRMVGAGSKEDLNTFFKKHLD